MMHFDAARVRELLPISECIDSIAEAMRDFSSGHCKVPPRTAFPLIDGSAFFAVMPGSSARPLTYGAKVVSLHPENPRHGRPAIQGFVALFDHGTGSPLALVDAAAVTALRTAAASAVATRELAPAEASTLGLLGTGVQAESHLEAICAVRSIREIRVWGRSAHKAKDFVERHSRPGRPGLKAVTSAREAAECDIVCTVTGAAEPVLFGEWIRPGAHVNLVGAHSATTREADTALIVRSRVLVDSRESARHEAGDLLIPQREGAIGDEHVIGELGELLLRRVQGRRAPTDITVYKSLGIVAQDLAAAWQVWQRHLARSTDID
jgi:ornithine cyclodeaminase